MTAISKKVELEPLFLDFIIKQRQKTESFEKIFVKKITVGSKENFAADKASLSGLMKSLVTDQKERNEAERGRFKSIIKLAEVKQYFKNINKITTDLIKTLEKVTDKNYSPVDIWQKIDLLISEFFGLEDCLKKLISNIRKA